MQPVGKAQPRQFLRVQEKSASPAHTKQNTSTLIKERAAGNTVPRECQVMPTKPCQTDESLFRSSPLARGDPVLWLSSRSLVPASAGTNGDWFNVGANLNSSHARFVRRCSRFDEER